MIVRSVLFAPANHPRRSRAALDGSADAVILDLEDSVPETHKAQARAAALEMVASDDGAGPLRWVRINGLATAHALDDLEALVVAGVDAVVLPKVESAAQILIADWMIAQLERTRGLEIGGIEVLPMVETALGLARLQEIATASARVRRISFGAADFTLDLNMSWEPGHPGLLYARLQLVIASRLANLLAPIDMVFTDLADHRGFEREAEEARKLGFGGKACIHPSQVEIANRVFAPSPQQVAEARMIVDAFQAALAQGLASIQVGGRFVDHPIAEQARRILQESGQDF